MGESTKAVCGLLVMIGAISSVLAWLADQPGEVTWGFRIGGPAIAVIALALILVLQFRLDHETDYLHAVAGNYFNRDGFCFAFSVLIDEQILNLIVHFQSQYDQQSQGRIALRPARGFFLTRANFPTVTVAVDCPPAGFGFIRIPIPLPEELHGKRQALEVGATVHFPDGKGRRLRFRDGIFLRTNGDFGNRFGTTLTVAGAMTGTIVLTSPAKLSLQLPVNVATVVPPTALPETRVLWQLGDPELAVIA